MIDMAQYMAYQAGYSEGKKATPRWISTKDALPNDEEKVLIVLLRRRR